MAAVVTTEKPGNTYLSAWTLTTADPTGDAISIPGARDRSVTVEGTFGGATATIEGSNDGATWVTAHNEAGSLIAVTAQNGHAIAENYLHFRAKLSAVGAGATLNIKLLSGARL